MRTERARPALDGCLGMCATAADGIRLAGGFGNPEPWRFDWEQRYTRETYLDLLPTQGHLTRLPPRAIQEILDAVGAAVDAMGGSLTIPYSTVAVTAALAAAA